MWIECHARVAQALDPLNGLKKLQICWIDWRVREREIRIGNHWNWHQRAVQNLHFWRTLNKRRTRLYHQTSFELLWRIPYQRRRVPLRSQSLWTCKEESFGSHRRFAFVEKSEQRRSLDSKTKPSWYWKKWEGN